MILFTNGCSWTWGGGLFETLNSTNAELLRTTSVWPYHLGQLCNSEKVINLSCPAGSNQRICRTTFDYFLKEHDKNVPTMAVIQFSVMSRYEYYDTNDINDFTNNPLLWARCTSEAVYNLNNKKHIQIIKDRHKLKLSTYTEIEGMYKHINECSSLAYLFNTLNIPYVFWNFSGINEAYPKIYKNYFNQLNYYNTLNDWHYERISEQDQHPSLLGHKQIADILYSIIKPSIIPSTHTSVSCNC